MYFIYLIRPKQYIVGIGSASAQLSYYIVKSFYLSHIPLTKYTPPPLYIKGLIYCVSDETGYMLMRRVQNKAPDA